MVEAKKLNENIKKQKDVILTKHVQMLCTRGKANLNRKKSHSSTDKWDLKKAEN